MDMQNREAYMAKYNEKTHFYGRIGLWIGIALLIAFRVERAAELLPQLL